MNKEPLIISGVLKLLFVISALLPALSYSQHASAPAAYGAIPTQYQVEWQKMEYYMFIHFGPNTFTDVEWGHGDEDPKVFNPASLDARQWARTAKNAGMKGIIITAKHHDGFCLWPSKYSTHTVRESAWKDGKGDVLKELSDACREYDLKFGVYLSPWDQNHPSYGTPEYNTVFANTLTEVLTNYGSVFEQWFDGANGEGPNGKRQVYNWQLFNGTVLKHQPHAIIFSDIGPGTRWVGNEDGFAGTTNWSTLNVEGFTPGSGAPSRKSLNEGDENGNSWIPAECDVSIRPGWFYSPASDDKVKSLHQLLAIYYGSVGRNGNLLLNVPVDRRGLIPTNDSLRLMELKKTLDEAFKINIAKGKAITASNTRLSDEKFSASNITDGNFETYWATDDGQNSGFFIVDLKKAETFNRLLIQEYIPLGQRISSFSIEYWDGAEFKGLDTLTTIGYKRILTFPTITTSKIRVNILESKAPPLISEFQLFNAPGLMALPVIQRNKSGDVSIFSESADVTITYTTDGSDPMFTSERYVIPFPLINGGTVKARAFINNGNDASETVISAFDIAPVKWKVVSGATDDKKERMIDGNPNTVWVSDEKGVPEKEIVLDLGSTYKLKGLTYLPRQDKKTAGIIFQYRLYVSEDGMSWKKVIDNGSFSNIRNNPVIQRVKFPLVHSARYIKLEPVSTVNENDKQLSVAEIGVITR